MSKVLLFLSLIAFSFALKQFDSKHFSCASNGNCEIFDWRKIGRASSEDSHTITIVVGLKENAGTDCSAEIMKVSDPESPQYGKYYSLEQIGHMFSDRQKTSQVLLWLKKNGIQFSSINVSPNGDFITVTDTVAKLEQLLKAQFYLFESEIAHKVIKRTSSYSIPERVVSSIRFIGNTIRFPPTRMAIVVSKVDQSGNVSPDLLSKYYNVSSNTVATHKATQSVFESLGQSFSPNDLSAFENQFQIPGQPIAKVIGPNDPSSCSANPNNCAEAELDTQYIIAMAQGAPTTYWSIDQNVDDIFLNWIQAVASASNPPHVHSISYGSLASEDDESDMESFNTEACKLGLRGLTILVSSGDDGVANFGARNDPSKCGFQPSFPATSPYVTAVGATQGPEFGKPEVACCSDTGGLITTGGGFSITFPRPSYQDEAIKTYFATAPELPPKNLFASEGRGYPDLAMLGHNYQIVIGGVTYVVSGTSASSPVLAGLVTLINGERLVNGKSTVGFLNPAIYKLAKSQPNVFHDITVGRNNCAAGNPGSIVCCPKPIGFNSTVGWDPLTGWGSVNYDAFSKAMINL